MERAMDIGRRPTVSVLEHFRSFWADVATLRDAAVSQALPPSEAGDGTALVHVPTSVRERLLNRLRAQDAEIGTYGKSSLAYFRDAQYVMAAMADEVFVTLPWSGARYWSANLLETQLFGTRFAGQAIFARIERLVQQGQPEHRELAAVYLTALALGFRGKYLDRVDGGAITRYKARLHEFIFGKAPDLTHPFRRLLPQCYGSTIVAGEGRRLRNPRVWWWMVAAVVIAWLITSHVLWVRLVDPLNDPIRTIRTLTGEAGGQ
jgi:type VI secretion system protein ImpK